MLVSLCRACQHIKTYRLNGRHDPHDVWSMPDSKGEIFLAAGDDYRTLRAK